MPKEIAGISIGQSGASRAEVVEGFAKKGARISEKSIAHLRADKRTGDVLAERVACAQLLREGTPAKKDEVYGKITGTAVELRLPQVHFPHRHSSLKFTDRVASALEISLTVIERILRAMRTEAIMSAPVGFHETVIHFLRSYDHPYTVSKSPTLQNLINMREKGVVFVPDKFYRAVYQHPSSRFIGAWATYEVEWLDGFYAGRLQTQAPFSPLDRAVLEATSQGKQGFLPPALAFKTRVPVDIWVVATHTNALLDRYLLRRNRFTGKAIGPEILGKTNELLIKHTFEG